MRRIALVMFLMVGASASAQFPNRPGMYGGAGGFGGFGQNTTPTVSPYVNLLRGGNSTLLNYYGLVRPELNFAQALQGVSDTANANSAAINGMDGNGMASTTGSAVRFMNTGPFFMRMAGNGGGSGYGGGGVGQQAQGVVNTRYAPASGRGGINAGSPFGASGLNSRPGGAGPIVP